MSEFGRSPIHLRNLTMKIITWNACCKLREKLSLLAPFDADIMVIQECEDPQRASSDSYSNFASNALWIGHNKNKGVNFQTFPTLNVWKALKKQ